MTLVVATGNSQAVVLGVDRRTTLSDGSVFDEDADKVAAITTDDARLGVAFTGLATFGVAADAWPPLGPQGFRTLPWLLHELGDAALPDHQIEPMIQRFCAAAAVTFARNVTNTAARDRGVLIAFAGYRHFIPCEVHGRPACTHPFNAFVTNFALDGSGDVTERLEWTLLPDFMPYGIFLGTAAGIDRKKWAHLRELVDGEGSVTGIRDLTADLISSAAESPKSEGRVGRTVTTLVIPREPLPMEGRYHPVGSAMRIPFVSELRAQSPDRDGGWIIRDQRWGSSEPMAVGKLPRNARCYCGSGKKFKKCHGALSPQGATEVQLMVERLWDDEPKPALVRLGNGSIDISNQ